MGHALGTLYLRHAAISSSREHVGVTLASSYKDEAGEVEEPEIESDNPLEISTGRESVVGVDWYAVRSDIVGHRWTSQPA